MSVEAVSDAVWAALGVLTVTLAAGAHLPRSRLERLSAVLHRIEAARIGYVAVVLGWMWVGWHFFAR